MEYDGEKAWQVYVSGDFGFDSNQLFILAGEYLSDRSMESSREDQVLETEDSGFKYDLQRVDDFVIWSVESQGDSESAADKMRAVKEDFERSLKRLENEIWPDS